MAQQQGTSSGQPIAVLNQEIVPRLPSHSPMLFAKKKEKNLSFETIAKELGREEVAVAAIFYGQAQASEQDIKKLCQVLEISEPALFATRLLGSLTEAIRWRCRQRSLRSTVYTRLCKTTDTP